MPIYEYHCDDCDYDFELLQSINESHSGTCPTCHKNAKKKISIPGGLVFKGSGFYITDYNKSNGGSHSSITDSVKKDNSSGNGKKNGPKKENKSGAVSTPTK
jgi:putative FmdB family regulatory protein